MTADAHTIAAGREALALEREGSVHCLAVSRADHADSAATGTAVRADTLCAYALRAGFSKVEVLTIENDFWRFDRLDP